MDAASALRELQALVLPPGAAGMGSTGGLDTDLARAVFMYCLAAYVATRDDAAAALSASPSAVSAAATAATSPVVYVGPLSERANAFAALLSFTDIMAVFEGVGSARRGGAPFFDEDFRAMAAWRPLPVPLSALHSRTYTDDAVLVLAQFLLWGAESDEAWARLVALPPSVGINVARHQGIVVWVEEATPTHAYFRGTAKHLSSTTSARPVWLPCRSTVKVVNTSAQWPMLGPHDTLLLYANGAQERRTRSNIHGVGSGPAVFSPRGAADDTHFASIFVWHGDAVAAMFESTVTGSRYMLAPWVITGVRQFTDLVPNAADLEYQPVYILVESESTHRCVLRCSVEFFSDGNDIKLGTVDASSFAWESNVQPSILELPDADDPAYRFLWITEDESSLVCRYVPNVSIVVFGIRTVLERENLIKPMAGGFSANLLHPLETASTITVGTNVVVGSFLPETNGMFQWYDDSWYTGASKDAAGHGCVAVPDGASFRNIIKSNATNKELKRGVLYGDFSDDFAFRLTRSEGGAGQPYAFSVDLGDRPVLGFRHTVTPLTLKQEAVALPSVSADTRVLYLVNLFTRLPGPARAVSAAFVNVVRNLLPAADRPGFLDRQVTRGVFSRGVANVVGQNAGTFEDAMDVFSRLATQLRRGVPFGPADIATFAAALQPRDFEALDANAKAAPQGPVRQLTTFLWRATKGMTLTAFGTALPPCGAIFRRELDAVTNRNCVVEFPDVDGGLVYYRGVFVPAADATFLPWFTRVLAVESQRPDLALANETVVYYNNGSVERRYRDEVHGFGAFDAVQTHTWSLRVWRGVVVAYRARNASVYRAAAVVSQAFPLRAIPHASALYALFGAAGAPAAKPAGPRLALGPASVAREGMMRVRLDALNSYYVVDTSADFNRRVDNAVHTRAPVFFERFGEGHAVVWAVFGMTWLTATPAFAALSVISTSRSALVAGVERYFQCFNQGVPDFLITTCNKARNGVVTDADVLSVNLNVSGSGTGFSTLHAPRWTCNLATAAPSSAKVTVTSGDPANPLEMRMMTVKWPLTWAFLPTIPFKLTPDLQVYQDPQAALRQDDAQRKYKYGFVAGTASGAALALQVQGKTIELARRQPNKAELRTVKAHKPTRNTHPYSSVEGCVVRRFGIRFGEADVAFKAEYLVQLPMPGDTPVVVFDKPYDLLPSGVLAETGAALAPRSATSRAAVVDTCTKYGVLQRRGTCWMATAVNMFMFSPRLRGRVLALANEKLTTEQLQSETPPFRECVDSSAATTLATQVSSTSTLLHQQQVLWMLWHAACRRRVHEQVQVPECLAGLCAATSVDSGGNTKDALASLLRSLGLPEETLQLVSYRFRVSAFGMTPVEYHTAHRDAASGPDAEEVAYIYVLEKGRAHAAHAIAGGRCGDQYFTFDSTDGHTNLVDWRDMVALEAALTGQDFELHSVTTYAVNLKPTWQEYTCDSVRASHGIAAATTDAAGAGAGAGAAAGSGSGASSYRSLLGPEAADDDEDNGSGAKQNKKQRTADGGLQRRTRSWQLGLL